MRWAGYVAQILVGKPEGKIPLGKPKSGWVDNTEIDPKR
jgi:hypothetical protein